MDVEYKASVVSDCRLANCTDGAFAGNVAKVFEDSVVSAIVSGNLTTEIQRGAEAENIAELKSVTVKGDVPEFSFSYRVHTIRGDEVTDTDSGALGTFALSFSLVSTVMMVYVSGMF